MTIQNDICYFNDRGQIKTDEVYYDPAPSVTEKKNYKKKVL